MRRAALFCLWACLQLPAWAQVPPGMPLPGMSWKYSYVDRAAGAKQATIVVRVSSIEGAQVHDAALIEGEPQAARVAAVFDADEARFTERRLAGGIVLSEFSPYLLAQDGYERGAWSAIPGLAGGVRGPWRVAGRALGRETVRVKAGTFRALKVEIVGERDADLSVNPRFAAEAGKAFRYYAWYAEEVRRPVRIERRVIADSNRVILDETLELETMVAHLPGSR
jgi:hypothetical protein